MSGLPPINHHNDNLLPAVYRRSDIARQVAITGKHSGQRPPGEQLVDISNNGYKLLRKSGTAPVEPGATCPKGVIVDLWA